MLKFKNKPCTIKRQIRQIVSIMLVISLSIPAVTFAAGEESTYTYYADEAQYDGLNSTAAETGAYDGSHGRMHLQPSLQGKIIFTVNVAEAGEYTLDIVYTCGSAVNRKLGYSVNGGTTTYTGFLDKTGTWSITKNVTAAVTLKAGDNTIAVLSPTDYGKKVDAKTVGTPDIFAIKVSDTEKAVSLTKYADEAQYDGLNSTTAEAGTYEGSHGRVHLQPSLQSKIMFTANVKEAGEYTLDIVYTCGSAVNRKLGYSVNGGDPTYTEFLDKTGTWSTTKNVTAMVTLEAGDNTITLLSPSDYGETVDTKKVGTPDIFAVKLAPVPPAVTEGTLYADEAEYEGLKSTVADRTTLYDTTHGRIHLQPLELQGKIIFTVNVAEAGEYTLGIVYSGRGIVRKLGYSVNSGDVIYSDALEATQYWSAETAKTYKVNVTLNEGKNIITVLSPADYDGTTVGTPDIWAVKFAPAYQTDVEYEVFYEDISAYRTGTKSVPKAETGYIFAGWYTDADCTTSLSREITTGSAYAKFVDKDVLTVKAQITAGTTAGSEAADIRFVTTVDSLQYEKVGFEVTANGVTKTYGSNVVYKQLYAVSGSEVMTYVPNEEFSPISIYFKACTITGVPNRAFDMEWTVRPYWVTLDGTTVYGETAVKTVRMGM